MNIDDNVKRRDLGAGGMDLTGTNQRAEIVEILRNLVGATANLHAVVKGLLIAQAGMFIMLLGILIVLWSRP
jgi:hypothetical protein